MKGERVLSQSERRQAYMILGNLPLLDHVNFSTVKKITAEARLFAVPTATRLIQQDTKLADIFFVLRGLLRVTYGEAAEEYTPKLLAGPCLLGHLEMLTSQPTALAAVDVVEESWVAQISWSVVLDLLLADHALALSMLEDLAMDFLLGANAARQAAFGGLPGRIANVLLSHADLQVARGNGDAAAIPISRQQLAKYVASPRRSVIRVIQSLRAEGMIRDDSGHIIINDARRLREKFCPTSLGLAHRFRSPRLIVKK